MSPSTNTNSNLLLKVIGISELADRIYCFLNSSDLASLVCLSRRVFGCVVPAKWEDVDVQPLLMLIPGVEIFEDEINSAYEYVLSVPNDPDLGRFNIYAPHVKHLRGTPRYTVVFPTQDNSTLGPSLLPNLQHITLVSKRHYDHGDLKTIFVPIDIDWVLYFLCPTLLSLEMLGVNQPADYANDEFLPRMDSAACLRVANIISDRCPRMETLRMFPDDSSGTFSLPYAELTKMNHLRSFTWSGHRVDQRLMEVLGALPRLESLRFLSNIAETPNYYWDFSDSEDDPGRDTVPDPITIASGTFPALRSLELCRLGPRTIAEVCALGPLFRHLGSLKVVYEGYPSPYRRGGRTWSEDVFASLGDGSPHLSDLEISDTSELELTKVVERLRQMPLRRLSLPGVWVTDKVGWKEFAEALPNLEELELGLGLGSQWLRVFATTLPNLGRFGRPKGGQAVEREA
ncbi:hypothetical protein FRC10_001181 [Ceratobasidium sp. 414]|nr:hypothetical protein FRC10_001181 [Ceratobasidium sp. 414]